MGKQMEGDNEQRRKRAREAREEGSSASEEGVTLGASKQEHSLGRHDDHEDKMEAPGRGKAEPGSGRQPDEAKVPELSRFYPQFSGLSR